VSGLPPALVRLWPVTVARDEARALSEEALEPGVTVLARLPDQSGLWGRAEVVAKETCGDVVNKLRLESCPATSLTCVDLVSEGWDSMFGISMPSVM